ncbi:MAG: helix-turn-helix domain-containing protein [Spirochaetales bacterium]|nr:helix-turn-helix domain-containing protein [Spirochaetales bacterium]MDD6840708.1 helix-turn-helix domain-containing protein [Spirochaetales bacterium]
MVGENIIFLRKRNGMTQEALSERINVSRQTVAKWERGESEPDCSSLMRLSTLFNVTIDALVGNVDEDQKIVGVAPKGKYFFGMVKIGEDGSIVLPQKALEIFNLSIGSELAVLGDEDRGFALVPKKQITDMFSLVDSDK